MFPFAPLSLVSNLDDIGFSRVCSGSAKPARELRIHRSHGSDAGANEERHGL